MLTQEAIFIATIKGTSLVIKTRPFDKVYDKRITLKVTAVYTDILKI